MTTTSAPSSAPADGGLWAVCERCGAQMERRAGPGREAAPQHPRRFWYCVRCGLTRLIVPREEEQ
jgi:hypothetical protein